MALDLNSTLDALGVALKTIPGLRVYDYPPDSIAPPAAVVYATAFAYDETLARGVDRATFAIYLAVSANSDRASRDALAAYVAGTGPLSVKTAVDGTLGGVVKDARVTGGEHSPISVGGVEYHGAVFNVEVFA